MIRYYSRSNDDTDHLYRIDDETGKFCWMDHCLNRQGEWVLRDEPLEGIVEISEERAHQLRQRGCKKNKSQKILRIIKTVILGIFMRKKPKKSKESGRHLQIKPILI